MDNSLSISRQCELLGIARSSFYYKPRPESELNLELMRLIDEIYTEWPFYGIPRITAYLRNKGYNVNHKRVERLMRLMGLRAIYPKKRLSKGNKVHRIYPYLLEGVDVTEPDQVWCVLDVWFCIEALKEALRIRKPEIFNTDQGSQFTSYEFTGILQSEGILISMDGRGRVFDNIFVERLWRSLKYEEVRMYGRHEENIRRYFLFYNKERLHSALSYRTPKEVYNEER